MQEHSEALSGDLPESGNTGRQGTAGVAYREWGLVLVVCLAGVLVRFWKPGLEAVEHFDEGVYSSVLWYDGLTGQSWPSREFFAPAGLPFLIELASLLPGGAAMAPFLPSLILGCLTPLAVWCTARQWYGQAAGFFALCVSAGSDYHILYSRTALTDVPTAFFLVLSVGLGTLAVHRASARLAVISGVACGCGWWLKYSGWLPIAILLSGSGAWWLFAGRRTYAFRVLVLIQVLMIGTAFLVFAPYWWSLQSSGGYSAVTSHHGGYLSSFKAWSGNLAEQLAYQFRMDGYVGALTLGLGCLLAGWSRCSSASRSTWNVEMGHHPSATGNPQQRQAIARLRVRVLLIVFSITVIALRARTPLVLCCVTIGGLAGLYMSPPKSRSRAMRFVRGLHCGWGTTNDKSGRPGHKASIDPSLAFWVTLAWFTGLLVFTPLYAPYSRLFLPFMMSVWLGAAGAATWWLESNVRLARRVAEGVVVLDRAERFSRGINSALLAFALLASLLVINPDGSLEVVSRDELFSSRLFQDRRSIRTVAGRIAAACVASADGVDVSSRKLRSGETFTASSLEFEEPSGPELPIPSPEKLREIPMVVYGYGEPALLMNLYQAGLTPLPVSHFQLTPSKSGAVEFLVIGPNAWRTPGFAQEWSLVEHRFEWLGDFEYVPGEISLMDLYSANYLSDQVEPPGQRFELYRIRGW